MTNGKELAHLLPGLAPRYLIDFEEHTEGVWVCRPRFDWGRIAREASKGLRGQVWPGKDGITWVCGRKRQWLLGRSRLGEVEKARSAVSEVLPVETLGWTTGNISRKLLEWTGCAQMRSRMAEAMLAETGWHYHLCYPGRYDATCLYDMRAAYYSILSRLPSPRVHVDRNGVFFGGFLDGREEERWRLAMALVGEHKGLRNCLIGCASGGGDGATYYAKGEPHTLKGKMGPLRSGAFLVVRTVWELCHLAAVQTGAVYANVDSVITPEGAYPDIWETFGMELKREAAGVADICTLGVYKVGAKETLWYAHGARWSNPSVPPPPPSRYLVQEWLPVAA